MFLSTSMLFQTWSIIMLEHMTLVSEDVLTHVLTNPRGKLNFQPYLPSIFDLTLDGDVNLHVVYDYE